MLRTIPALLLLGLALLVACQPQSTVLEVTRLVEVRERVEVEVTRIVPATVIAEATRLIAEEVEVVVEVTKEPLGSEVRPVQLLFPPLYEADLIVRRGKPLAEALSEATGYQFSVGVLDSEQAVIDLMCAAPVDTIGVLSPAGYVLAHEQCGVQIGSVAVSDDGLTSRTGMIVSRNDSDIDDLQSLEGKRWAVPDEKSLSDTVYFQAMLQSSDIELEEIVPVAGESVAMLAVHEGQVDMATAEFVPPILPFEEIWDREADDPEPWRALGHSPERSPIGYVRVLGEPENGGYRVRDARSRIIDVAPEIFENTEIVALSAPIPNTTIAFGRDFPLGLARQLESELAAFSGSPQCQASLCASDFLAWQGLVPAQDEMFDPIRFVRDELDLSAAEMFELRQ